MKFFNVSHYGKPEVDLATWKLEVSGLVDNPLLLTIEDIKARPRQEVTFTLECSGNHGFPTFTGAIGNAKWAGTPLAPILKEAGIQENGIEVIFFGHDVGEEERRKVKMRQNFARSMSVEDALADTNLLCYEMNGEPLPHANGAPLRLIAPGWYGIACVKWLKRIEVRSTRYMGRFMGRDYVTMREEKRPDGESVWMETSVGRTQLKSLAAKVTRIGDKYRIYGAAWGAPIKTVEVSIDGGAWQTATIDPEEMRNSHGKSGISIGTAHQRVNTPSFPEPLTRKGTSNPQPILIISLESIPIGRATDRSSVRLISNRSPLGSKLTRNLPEESGLQTPPTMEAEQN